MIFQKSKLLKDYKTLITKLTPDFGDEFKNTIITWCTNDYSETCFWEIWIIKENNNTIGICGLYSQHDNTTKELWLGWLGIIPKYRNSGLGKDVMKFLYKQAKKVKCKTIYSYVDKDGKPLNFYYREGFNVICKVKQYLKDNPDVDRDGFENLNDYIIKKDL